MNANGVVVRKIEIVDNETLAGILAGHLDDFDRFIAEVRSYAEREPETTE